LANLIVGKVARRRFETARSAPEPVVKGVGPSPARKTFGDKSGYIEGITIPWAGALEVGLTNHFLLATMATRCFCAR
jgi:hypothetical protein